MYRALLVSYVCLPVGPDDDAELERRRNVSAMRCAFAVGLGDGWDELPYTQVEDPRLRFWFTETGWRSRGGVIRGEDVGDRVGRALVGPAAITPPPATAPTLTTGAHLLR